MRAELLMGLTLELVAERIKYDMRGGVEMDKLSDYWFRLAVEKRSAPAQYLLAELDWRNLSNCDEVLKLLNDAAAQNYVPALTRIGRLYMEGGCGIKPDYAQGLKWLRRASQAGDAEADYQLGKCYEQGRGVGVDLAEAARWFLKGAQIGDADSQLAIGIALAEGNGTEKNSEEAVDWIRKSAEQGNWQAACNLTLAYMRGEGVEKDLVVALMWGVIADRNATEIGCLSEIESPDLLKMTDAQVAGATQRANAWLRDHHYPSTEPPTRSGPGAI